MQERTVRVGSKNGLHARPARLFTQAAEKSGAAVSIEKLGGAPANAASILAVISLGIDHDDEVRITVDGPGEATIVVELADLLATDHDGR